MRLFLFVGATIGLIGCISAQITSEGNRHPCEKKVWQSDGYRKPGQVWVDNPYYEGPCPTETTTYSTNSEDFAIRNSQFPGEDRPRPQNPKFEAKIPEQHGMNTHNPSSGMYYQFCLYTPFPQIMPFG